VSRYAVIDVGTNSVKFHIGERKGDGSWHTVVDRSEITRLGEGRERNGAIQPEPMARTVDAVAGMAEEAEQEGVGEVAAVGTAALRAATNSQDFVDAVQVHERVIEVEQRNHHSEKTAAFLRGHRGDELAFAGAQRSRAAHDRLRECKQMLRPSRIIRE